MTAREYTERQLAQAQTAIQDLRTRMRHVHQERESAVSAAQSAMMAKETAERNMRAAETALATERGTRIRTEGMLRDAETTVRDLREKLGTANQSLHLAQAELAAERLTRPEADDVALPMTAVVDIKAPTDPEPVVQIIRRPVGRPRKTPVVELAQASMWQVTQPTAISADVVPVVRRPVGRPRKAQVVEQSVEQLIKPLGPPQRSAKSERKKAGQQTDDQEPVQWWVEGWKGR